MLVCVIISVVSSQTFYSYVQSTKFPFGCFVMFALFQELDKSLQKKCYRILEDICSGSSEELRDFVTSNLATIQETLLMSLSTSSPSSKAVNLVLLQFLCVWGSSSESSMSKINIMTVHPAKTQISLGIHPVWSESLLCAQWVAKDPSFLHADSEDSDQTGQMPSLIWVFTGRTCHCVCFVMKHEVLCDKAARSLEMGLRRAFEP